MEPTFSSYFKPYMYHLLVMSWTIFKIITLSIKKFCSKLQVFTQKGSQRFTLHTSDIPHLFTVVIPVGFKLVYHLH